MDLRSFAHRTAAPEITIDEGEAVLIAARVVQQASSAIEIVWDFVRHIPDTPAQDKEDRQGYLVGWRDGDARYEVIVAFDGRPGELLRVPLATSQRTST